MADHDFERIQPATLDTAPRTPGIRASAASVARAPRAVDPAVLTLALLLVIGALVLFVLPRFLSQPAPPAAHAPAAAARETATPPAPSAAASKSPTSAAAPAPWEQAQGQRERDEAKSALDALLALQYELQEMRAEVWAPAEFAEATAAAKRGDEAWRADRYAEARQAWRDGERVLLALKEGIAARLEARLAAGAAAFAAGDGPAAVLAYAQALSIEPENAPAQQGLARAGQLGQLQQLLADGQGAEQGGDDAAAQAKYRAALALDGAWPPAQQALAALEQRITARKAEAEVSAGYAALAAGRIEEARRAFQAALKLGAGAPARDGLQQADFQSSQQRIAGLLAKIEQAERAEQWQAALDASKAALAMDPALSTARTARDRAGQRLVLDRALEKVLHDPDSLTTDATRASAEKLLGAAASIADPGPRLRAQLEDTRARLAQMRTKIAVNLASDGQTQVTVFRVGDLGRFAKTDLELLPGNYVAVGRREGYRDVRVEFAVRPGTASPLVSVQCQQKI